MNLGKTYASIGTLFTHLGQYSEAVHSLEKALDIYTAIKKINKNLRKKNPTVLSKVSVYIMLFINIDN